MGTNALGLSPDAAFLPLGERCRDVYLNEHRFWRCAPARVGTYTLGGYPLVKKWLREVTAMLRRIAALVLLEPELNGAYAAARAAGWGWE